MEGEHSILDAVFEDDDFDNGEDVDMDDLEEGELVQFNSLSIEEQSSGSNVAVANQECKGRNQKRKAKRKKNKKINKSLGPNVTDIDRERFLVDAVQACGGQMTHDGRRFRTGGGVLWSIIKAREPNAYKEIMKKAREFEKQFKNARSMQAIGQRKEGSFQGTANSCKDGAPVRVSDSLPVIHPKPEGKHICVHDRLRRPVSYDDELLGGAPSENALTY